MIRRPPRSTRTDTLFPTRRSSDLVGSCNLELDRAIAFERYADNRKLGGFILIDRQTHATVACGTIDFALRRAANLHWQSLDIDKAARARSTSQLPRCLWSKIGRAS